MLWILQHRQPRRLQLPPVGADAEEVAEAERNWMQTTQRTPMWMRHPLAVAVDVAMRQLPSLQTPLRF
jgi:hypothetical protein